MKLPVFGAPGAREPRMASGILEAAAGAPPLSRAQKASSTYQAPSPAGAPPAGGPNMGTQQTAPTAQTAASAQAADPAAAAAAPPQYDLSADPVLQQVQAATTLGNQQAHASALDAEEQALLAYGDPALAAKILGVSDPMDAAAGKNQESTLALLKRGYNTGLSNYDNNLDPSLLFSGARIKGEGQIGQTYQDELARAAAGIQAQLGGINDTLDTRLQANQDRYLQALADAYARALQNALVNPPADGSGDGSGSGKPTIHPPIGSLAAAAAAGNFPAIVAALGGRAGGI